MKRIVCVRRVAVAPVAMMRALVALDEWPQWVPGLLEHGLPAPSEVRCTLRGPVPLRLHLRVTATTDGVRFGLVEGDLSDVSGHVSVLPDGRGSVVRWDLEISAPTTVPGPLWQELADHTIPRWTGALAAHASVAHALLQESADP